MILLQGLARAITCGTRALLMENQSAQNDANSSVNILYSLLHFKGSLPTFPTFRVEENVFGLQTIAGHVLCANATGLSGYDCIQNINWK